MRSKWIFGGVSAWAMIVASTPALAADEVLTAETAMSGVATSIMQSARPTRTTAASRRQDRRRRREQRLAADRAQRAKAAIARAEAQGQPDDMTSGNIIVTGTLIPGEGGRTGSPVHSITRTELENRGLSHVEQALAQDPSVHPGLGGFQGGREGGPSGIDLRGLGTERTLALVNGQRTVNDTNTIPGALLERVDILTGGASAVYGSDAMAGVVNYVLKRNFVGLTINGEGKVFQHANRNDAMRDLIASARLRVPPRNFIGGPSGYINAAYGLNFDDKKGNITLLAGYRATSALDRSNFDTTGCDLVSRNSFDAPVGSLFDRSTRACWVRQYNPYSRFAVVGQTEPPPVLGQITQTLPGGTIPKGTYSNAIDGGKAFRPYTENDMRNASPDGRLWRSDTRLNYGTNLRYSFSDRAELLVTYSHTAYDTKGTEPNYTVYSADIKMNCDNPYMSLAQARLICGTLAGDPNAVKSVNISYHPEGWLNQYFYNNREDKIFGQLKGKLDKDIRYEINANWLDFKQNYRRLANADTRRFTNAVRARDVNGTIVCLPPQDPIVPGSDASGRLARVDAACQPIDVFSTAPLSEAGFDYVTGSPGANGSGNRQFVLNGNLAGRIRGLVSPLATEPVGFSILAEHRVNRFTGYTSGALLGLEPRTKTISIISEAAFELSLPVMQDKPLVRRFQVNGTARYGQYSTYSGNATTWNAGFTYEPIEGLSFRGNVSRSVRVPISQALAANSIATNQLVKDLCSPPSGTITQRFSFERCATLGVTRQQYDALTNRTDCNPIGMCPANFLYGGNPALKPEVGTSLTVGVTIAPRALPGFSTRFDLYKIKISRFFSANEPGLAFDSCARGLASYCDLYVRDPVSGRLDVPGAYADARSTNAGFHDTRGLDIISSYRLDLARLFGGKNLGSAGLNFSGNLRLSSLRQDFPGLQSFDCTSYYGFLCGQPLPKWRHTLRVAWSLPWSDLTLNANWRYASATRLSTLSSAERLKANPNAVDPLIRPLDNYLRASSYFDAGASIEVMEQVSLRINVLNVLDTEPRLIENFIGGTNWNTVPTLYDPLGRTITVGFNAKF